MYMNQSIIKKNQPIGMSFCFVLDDSISEDQFQKVKMTLQNAPYLEFNPNYIVFENQYQDSIAELLNNLGLKFSIPKKTELPVYGMKCKNCQRKVRECIQKDEKVVYPDVNLQTKNVSIFFKEELNIEKIKSGLSELGFKFEPPVIEEIKKIEENPLKNEEKKPILININSLKSLKVKIKGISMEKEDLLRERFKNENGVFKLLVHLVDEKIDIEFDSEIISQDSIMRILANYGQVSIEMNSNVDDLNLDVFGMTCSSCVSKIETMLNSKNGILQCSVSLMTNSTKIKYQNDIIGVRDIINEISKLGFTANIHDEKEENSDNFSEINLWKRRLIVSVIFTIPVVILAMWDDMTMSNTNMIGIRWIEVLTCLFTTPVHFYCGWNFHKATFYALRNKYADMNVLISIATNAAYFYSLSLLCLTFIYSTPINRTYFFETCAMLIALMNLGKYLESIAKKKTSNAISELLNLQAKTATLIKEDKTEEIVKIELIQKGDLIKIIPGESVPTDGVISEGTSSLNESMLTGEGNYVTKTVGDNVIGGTLNNDGVLYVKVSKVGSETMLAQIVKLVKDSQNSKAPIQRYADNLSRIFVPFVILLSLITFTTWLILSTSQVIPQDWIPHGSNPFLFSLLFSMAVLVVACPCAFGLATPTAVMVSTGLAAKLGILIKGGEPLELAHKMNFICFDKTGTLTIGKPDVSSYGIFDKEISEEEFFSLVRSLEKNTDHPIGKSLYNYSRERCQVEKEIENFKNVPGQGLECKIDQKLLIIGSQKYIEKFITLSNDQSVVIQSESEKARTIILVMYDSKVLGYFSLSDTIKPEALYVIKELYKLGIKTALLSGDRKEVVDNVSNILGIKVSLSSLLPQKKLLIIQKLQEKGYTVGMIGDGINDSPALTQSDVGIAIGAGSDIALESANIILVKNDLMDLLTAIDLSKRTFSRIKWNHFWALGYNVVLIPLACGFAYPFFKIVIPPMLAAVMMSSSSILVVLSSLLLRFYKPPNKI